MFEIEKISLAIWTNFAGTIDQTKPQYEPREIKLNDVSSAND